MVITGARLIELALRRAGVGGVGQQPLPEDSADALDLLNMMLTDWSAKRWLMFHLLDLSVVGTGAAFYTIGPGGDIDTPRVDKLEAAYTRQITQAVPNQPDWPTAIVDSYEDYSRIALKLLNAGPAQLVFLDSDYPIGKIHPWPLINSTYELHVLVKSQLVTITDPTADLLFPGPYYNALYNNLAVVLRDAYDLPPKPVLNALAKGSLATIRQANFQIGSLQMPGSLKRWGAGSAYNIFNDTFGR